MGVQVGVGAFPMHGKADFELVPNRNELIEHPRARFKAFFLLLLPRYRASGFIALWSV